MPFTWNINPVLSSQILPGMLSASSIFWRLFTFLESTDFCFFKKFNLAPTMETASIKDRYGLDVSLLFITWSAIFSINMNETIAFAEFILYNNILWLGLLGPMVDYLWNGNGQGWLHFNGNVRLISQGSTFLRIIFDPDQIPERLMISLGHHIYESDLTKLANALKIVQTEISTLCCYHLII